MWEHIEKLLLLNAIISIGIINSQNGFHTIQSILFNSLGRPQRSRLQYKTVDFITKSGYPFENHIIHTEDGFLLNIHRIPYSRKDNSSECNFSDEDINTNNINIADSKKFFKCKKQPALTNPYGPGRPAVFIQHGILLSSESWVLQGPGKDLAYLLADAGYDVWLGNYRGNFHSRKHERLSPNSESFWDSSFHEMGVYDLPAVIDYILEKSCNEKLFYVGHSMGSTMFLVMNSERPEYNRKIRLAALMSPVTYLQHSAMSEPKKAIFVALEAFLTMLANNRIYEFLPRSNLGFFTANSICRIGSPLQHICEQAILAWAESPSRFTGKKLMPLILAHVPAGMPLKALLHFSQNTQLEKFQQYNYDFEENERRYNQSHPPFYNLKNVKAPVSIYYSSGDGLSVESDVKRLIRMLPNVVNSHRVANPKFNHVDFMWAHNADELIYKQMMDLFRKF